MGHRGVLENAILSWTVGSWKHLKESPLAVIHYLIKQFRKTSYWQNTQSCFSLSSGPWSTSQPGTSGRACPWSTSQPGPSGSACPWSTSQPGTSGRYYQLPQLCTGRVLLQSSLKDKNCKYWHFQLDRKDPQETRKNLLDLYTRARCFSMPFLAYRVPGYTDTPGKGSSRSWKYNSLRDR